MRAHNSSSKFVILFLLSWSPLYLRPDSRLSFKLEDNILLSADSQSIAQSPTWRISLRFRMQSSRLALCIIQGFLAVRVGAGCIHRCESGALSMLFLKITVQNPRDTYCPSALEKTSSLTNICLDCNVALTGQQNSWTRVKQPLVMSFAIRMHLQLMFWWTVVLRAKLDSRDSKTFFGTCKDKT